LTRIQETSADINNNRTAPPILGEYNQSRAIVVSKLSPVPKPGPGRYGKMMSEKMMKPDIKKTSPRITTNAMPIPLFRNSAGLPIKPIIAKIKVRLTTRTANQGTIVVTYCLAPATEMKTVAIRNEMNNESQALSPSNLVFANIAKIIIKTSRKAEIGAKYVIAVRSAGILILWSESSPDRFAC